MSELVNVCIRRGGRAPGLTSVLKSKLWLSTAVLQPGLTMLKRRTALSSVHFQSHLRASVEVHLLWQIASPSTTVLLNKQLAACSRCSAEWLSSYDTHSEIWTLSRGVFRDRSSTVEALDATVFLISRLARIHLVQSVDKTAKSDAKFVDVHVEEHPDVSVPAVC